MMQTKKLDNSCDFLMPCTVARAVRITTFGLRWGSMWFDS
jgi:hypothetical protein